MVLFPYYVPSVIISLWMLKGVHTSISTETFRLQKFREDVAIDVPILTTSATSAVACGQNCLVFPTCRSFAYSAAQSTCRLYDHFVQSTVNGIAVPPGTRYFWLLSPRCPTELGYTQVDNVCYKIHETWMTWTEAKEVCRKEGATLFVGDSAAKLAVLHARGWDQVWVGAFKDAMTGDWYFVDGTRLPTDSDLWDQDEPDNLRGIQNITMLSHLGGLDDTFPDKTFRTACQIQVL